MNNQIRLSVIMPVYNAENFLERSVGSLFRQGLAPGSFEVLLVNDGSTDNSLEMCQKLAEKHSEIRVIDKENGGVSSARNRGLNEARGEWVALLDADDYLLDNGYKTAFLPYAMRDDLDIIHYFSDYDFWPVRQLCGGGKSEGRTWDLMRQGKDGLPSFCWLYFYRKRFLERTRLTFKNYIVGEDQLFATQTYLSNPYMLTVKANIYRYVVHDDSATTRRAAEHSRRAVVDYISSYANILEYAHDQGADKDVGLWRGCMRTLDSKKMFAVSRMLSARYNRKEWKNLSRFCQKTKFWPVSSFADGVKNRLSVKVMNAVMRSWPMYVVMSFFMIHVVEPYVLPRLRYKFKAQ